MCLSIRLSVCLEVEISTNDYITTTLRKRVDNATISPLARISDMYRCNAGINLQVGVQDK